MRRLECCLLCTVCTVYSNVLRSKYGDMGQLASSQQAPVPIGFNADKMVIVHTAYIEAVSRRETQKKHE